jgi:hypothetical protein
MPSTLSWLDFSERDRRQLLDVVNLFRAEDTRDELGIGTIRDGFADLLFPGTSTVQTRARYYLFVPWMYRELEGRQLNADQVGRQSRLSEVRLIDVLAGSDDADGTIDVQARSALQRLPSNIYWRGLGSWGIRIYPGSQEQYHRAIAGGLLAGGRDVGRETSRGWHSGLPAAPKEFPADVSLALEHEEASYLAERIVGRHPETLLAWLVTRSTADAWAEFAWEHPQHDEFPEIQQEQLHHARLFSEAFHGAALLYNLMLAELVGRDDWVDHYRARLVRWSVALTEREAMFRAWDTRRFWVIVDEAGVRYVPSSRHEFIEPWIGILRDVGAPAIASSDAARSLVLDREAVLKRARARLTNPTARAAWNGASGASQLTFGWPTAQSHVNDILVARDRQGA